jgi:transposase
MARLRKSYGADFKAKVAIAAIKAEATTNELTAQYGVHGSQINSWKRQALEGLPGLLSDRRGQLRAGEHQALVDELYRQIGQLKVELDWLKKKSGLAGGGEVRLR